MQVEKGAITPSSHSGRAERALGADPWPLATGSWPLNLTKWDRPVVAAQEKMEELAQRAAVASAAIVRRLLQPVAALIEGGESLEQIRDELLRAYPEMAVEELAELLYQAAVFAYMQGRERRD